jgi:hypothetical protein
MTEWIIPPSPKHRRGWGMWSEGDGRYVDFERGVDMTDKEEKMAIQPPIHRGHLCPHGLNPIACLPCYHAKKNVPTPPPQRSVPQPTNPVIEAIKAKSGASPQGMVHVGYNPQTREPITTEEDQPKIRGKMPVPVQVGAVGSPSAASGGGGGVTAFDYARDQGRVDSKGQWRPARRPSLIDTLPRHPNSKQ